MKVLHICYVDNHPGANRAAYRLHKSLRKRKIESTFVVLNKLTNDPSVIELRQPFREFVSKVIEALFNIVTKKPKKPLFSFGIYSKLPLKSAFCGSFDIIQLHWLGRGTLDLNTLSEFKGPIVWRLPDMYPFTAGCHYSHSCEQYITGCQSCHYLRYPHLVKYLFDKKKRQLKKLTNLHVVSPSTWMYECTITSDALSGATKHQISTGVDTEVFIPMDKLKALEALNLKRLEGRKVVLFGAVSSTTDNRKGSKELYKSLEYFNEMENREICEFVIFGSTGDRRIERRLTNVTFIGHFTDEKSMAFVYNICDLMIVPSLEENLPNTAIEALACGKPVVAFKIGGLKDLVQHKWNGYLATPFEIEDLAEGIDWVLKNIKRADMNNNARQTILNRFDEKIVSKRYSDLYSEILKT